MTGMQKNTKIILCKCFRRDILLVLKLFRDAGRLFIVNGHGSTSSQWL